MNILKVVSLVLAIGIVGAEDAVTLTTPASKSSALPTSTQDVPSVKSTTSSSSSSASSGVPSSTTPSTLPTQSTTTVAPTIGPTTPAPPAPTTPKPKPPKEFFWNVTDPNGVICILAKADISLSLTYTNESSKQETKLDIPVPQNANSSGQCGSSSQILQLSFGSDSIAFNFTKNAGKYHLAAIHSDINVGEANNTTTFSLVSGQLELYDTHLNTSYVCSWSEPATLREEDAQRNVTKATMRVTLKLMRFEAFRNSTDDAFSKEYSCPMDSPDIVPVMVGIALGILVAVVLIAYLVGRRSTQAQGYLSM